MTLRKFNYALSLIFLLAIVRLFFMAVFPFIDPTEPRYAEIARIMSESGDWITPYFDYGVPFWGKPPLSFWLEAISIRLLGVSEFTIRLPSLIVTLCTMRLVYIAAKSLQDKATGYLASLMFFSSTIVFVTSGAALTDPFLAFSTTLSIVSFLMCLIKKETYWQYLFFIGLSVGLLAKGPIAAILILGPVCLWALLERKIKAVFEILPVMRGSLLTILLVAPWYIAAELKTPGFLNYFIIGEHFKRFLVGQWAGDLYGSAHQNPIGMIWAYWIIGAFPWSLAAIGLAFVWLKKFAFSADNKKPGLDSRIKFLMICTLFPMLFFTMAKNILWTYVLPSIPALSIILAIYLKNSSLPQRTLGRNVALTSFIISPAIAAILATYMLLHPEQIDTEKYMITQYFNTHDYADRPLYFIDDMCHSAKFYSQGKATLVPVDQLNTFKDKMYAAAGRVAVSNDTYEMIKTQLTGLEIYRNKHYTIIDLDKSQENVS